MVDTMARRRRISGRRRKRIYLSLMCCICCICYIGTWCFLPTPPDTVAIYCLQFTCQHPAAIRIDSVSDEAIYTRMLQDNVDNVVILHNDLIIPTDFWGKIESIIDSGPENWEMLQLWTDNKIIQRYMEHIDDTWISWMPEHTSKSAYILNRQGLQKCRTGEPVTTYTYTNVVVKTQWEVEFTTEQPHPHPHSTTLLISTTLIKTPIELEQEWNNWSNDLTSVRPMGVIFKFIVVVQTQEMFELVSGRMWNDDVQIIINPQPFSKFTYIQQFVTQMSTFDHVILKDSDIRLIGFPLQTFLRHKNAVIKGALRQTLQGHTDQRQWFKFQDGFRWKTTKTTQFMNMASEPVPFLEQFFVTFDGTFGRWFFEKTLTEQMLSDDGHRTQSNWGLDTLWCNAAREWSPTRTSCLLIPVIAQHDDTKQVILWNTSEERKRTNKKQLQKYLLAFPQWVSHHSIKIKKINS